MGNYHNPTHNHQHDCAQQVQVPQAPTIHLACNCNNTMSTSENSNAQVSSMASQFAEYASKHAIVLAEKTKCENSLQDATNLNSNCEASLSECNAALDSGGNSCSTNVVQLNNELSICKADLKSANLGLTNCENENKEFEADLTVCQNENKQFELELNSCKNNVTQIQNELDLCLAGEPQDSGPGGGPIEL